MKKLLWRVTYTTTFTASSGMREFYNDEKVCGYVATDGDSLGAVGAVLIERIRAESIQKDLKKLEAAEYIGEVIIGKY